MKKFFLIFIFLVTSCSVKFMNNPIKRVEEYLNEYKKLDNVIIKDLNIYIDTFDLTESEKGNYKKLFKKQYQDLEFEIKDDIIDNNKAIIRCEIKVYNYGKFLKESKKIESTKEKIIYTIYLTVIKEKEKWEVEDLTDIDLKKLRGTFYN